MTKRDSRLLKAIGKEWIVVFNFPTDYSVEELETAVKDGVARILAVKHVSGPMDERYWMDMELVKLDSSQQNRYNNYKIVSVQSDDSVILGWVDQERKSKMPVPQVKVSGAHHVVIERDGKLFIELTKKCISCGLTIKGTCAVSRKPDGSPGNIQMFVPDAQFAGAMPSKPKSKLWLCKEHAVSDVTSSVKEEYRPSGVTIPAPKKRPVAIITPKEYNDLKAHRNELVELVKALKKEMKDSVSIQQLEERFWNMVGSVDPVELNGMALLIQSFRKK